MRPENELVQMAHGTNACQGATRATHNDEQCSQACLGYFALQALSCCDKSDESDQKCTEMLQQLIVLTDFRTGKENKLVALLCPHSTEISGGSSSLPLPSASCTSSASSISSASSSAEREPSEVNPSSVEPSLQADCNP